MELENNVQEEPERSAIDALSGPALIEFGASWCTHCQGAQPWVDAVREQHPGLRFIWVEDGRGKQLGRSFGVKLWPTLIFLNDGQEVDRVVRPGSAAEIGRALDKIIAR